jgi:hypothetical protein
MMETTQEDWLDRQLREAALYIDDAGFTASVLAKLPAPRRQYTPVRAAILIGLAILGSLIACVISDGGRFLVHELLRLTILPISWLLFSALASGVFVAALGVAAAIAKTRELRYQRL